MERTTLAPEHEISRVIRGGWQLAGGHGAVDPDQAIDDLIAFADAGITTFDCADIYTGVEEMIGRFRAAYAARRGQAALSAVKIHTKLVPDLNVLDRLTKGHVEAVIDRSLGRLRTDRLDLVQFHWWDYAVPGWLDVAGWLVDMQHAGKVANIGGTNFDTAHMTALTDAGIPLAAMQVQYSLLDDRPGRSMVAAARKCGVGLLCYGTVAGGFLSDTWLGRAEPAGPLENRSLVKYKLIIDEFGGWDLFQDLLTVLRAIADRHGSDIATVASRAVLDRPGAAAIIVGARNRAHLDANLAISALSLSQSDRAAIDGVLIRRKGPPGDVYTLERDRNGPHGAIMRYNLNRGAA